ncbi:hypothetical protein Bbelb_140210 [Branchiostoma belcheri]|nr:hypothetical protein Bbelb_140210 [Branchiostoma belcheri]
MTTGAISNPVTSMLSIEQAASACSRVVDTLYGIVPSIVFLGDLTIAECQQRASVGAERREMTKTRVRYRVTCLSLSPPVSSFVSSYDFSFFFISGRSDDEQRSKVVVRKAVVSPHRRPEEDKCLNAAVTSYRPSQLSIKSSGSTNQRAAQAHPCFIFGQTWA